MAQFNDSGAASPASDLKPLSCRRRLRICVRQRERETERAREPTKKQSERQRERERVKESQRQTERKREKDGQIETKRKIRRGWAWTWVTRRAYPCAGGTPILAATLGSLLYWFLEITTMCLLSWCFWRFFRLVHASWSFHYLMP